MNETWLESLKPGDVVEIEYPIGCGQFAVHRHPIARMDATRFLVNGFKFSRETGRRIECEKCAWDGLEIRPVAGTVF